MIFAMLAAAALRSCGDGPSDLPVVPAPVAGMMASEFPADGHIHMQSRGRFLVKPDTRFCTVQNGFGVAPDALRRLFKFFNQPHSMFGSDRGGMPAEKYRFCALPSSVLMKGVKQPNREGGDYKIVLAVWQGDPRKPEASWVGIIERPEGARGDEPDLPSPVDYSPNRDGRFDQTPENIRRFKTAFSRNRDRKDLSEAFVKSVTMQTEN